MKGTIDSKNSRWEQNSRQAETAEPFEEQQYPDVLFVHLRIFPAEPRMSRIVLTPSASFSIRFNSNHSFVEWFRPITGRLTTSDGVCATRTAATDMATQRLTICSALHSSESSIIHHSSYHTQAHLFLHHALLQSELPDSPPLFLPLESLFTLQ